MPRYSIILPVRNGGEYVKICVNSILAQSYRDFELLVLDNCSTDNTQQWIRSVNDPRIVIYPADRPLTIEENWTRITTVPKAEFITLIGHDDLLQPDFLAVIDELVQKHPGASLYETHFTYMDSAGAVIRPCKPMAEVQSPAGFLASILANQEDIMGTGFVMRSADYDRIGGIPAYPNLLFADFELWFRLTHIAYKATAAAECFSFRLHQSTTTTSADIKYHQAFNRAILFLAQLKKDDPALAPVIEAHAPQFIRYHGRGLAHRLLRTPVDKREGNTVAGFLTQCRQYVHMLAPGSPYNPAGEFSLRLAKWIDSYALTRRLFLAFKKIYRKPLYTK
jgi:glycosyltransferase involved in cell wall biosynthesis